MIKLSKVLRFALPGIFLILNFACIKRLAAQSSPTEKQRVQRLAGVAKVWGAMKYIHPFPVYRNIDLDKALIETIPLVNAAQSPQEYNAAINHLLSSLNDSETFAEIKSSSLQQPQPILKDTNCFYIKDSILVLDLLTLSENGTMDLPQLQRVFPKIISSLSGAKAIVADCRGKSSSKLPNEKVQASFSGLLGNLIFQICDQPIILGSIRYRIHNGYAPQKGSTSGDYHSGLMQSPPRFISGQNEKTALPLIFIFNSKTPPASEIFNGLQAANRAFLISEGDIVQSISGSYYNITLADSVVVKMRKTEKINSDGTFGVVADVSVQYDESQDAALTEAFNRIRTNTLTHNKKNNCDSLSASPSNKDKFYDEAAFPSTELRLLGLFRFWNIINYFYPYKDFIAEDWDVVLSSYILKIEANKTAVDYQLTIGELGSELHDSHTLVRGANALSQKLGDYLPPVFVRYIGKQVVVKKIIDNTAGLSVGDVVLAVDGVAVEQRHDFFSHISSASTPQAFDYRFALDDLLRGQKDSKAKLTLRGANGKIREVLVARSVMRGDPQFLNHLKRDSDVVRILPDNIAYVDLDRLTVSKVDEMFESIKNTKAVIFDMRGYPNLTGWKIAPRLTQRKNVVGAIFSRPIIEGVLLNNSDYINGTDFTFSPPLEEVKGDRYKGKVVVLIDESAYSQAEHTCLLFEAATKVTFIGMPTMGIDGDVTNLVLPGNLSVTFTGQSVRHADGRRLQNIGIIPDIKVEPTIHGIAHKRDEILEAAVRFLKGKK